MGLFEKKYDFEKDNLRLVFNSEKNVYDVYYGFTLISYSKLNRKSKKYIDNENNRLRTNSDLLFYELERAMIKYRFNKLKSLGYSCDCFEYLGQVDGTMSTEMEYFLNNLVNEKDVLIGIHRIGNNDSSEKLADIFQNGLEITGHLGGVAQSNRELKNNVGYYPDNRIIIKELMYADEYKDSKGSILIRIPDYDLDKNIFVIDDNGRTRLNPKYIVGYVPVYENHHLESIITPNMINTMNSLYSYKFQERENNNQIYQERVEYRSRR